MESYAVFFVPETHILRKSERPSLTVHSTILRHGLVIMVNEAGVEELASLWRPIHGRILEIVNGLLGTGRGAEAWIEGIQWKDLEAHVRVFSVAVERCVDCCFAECDAVFVADGTTDSVLHVAIDAGDYDVEVMFVVAGVGC